MSIGPRVRALRATRRMSLRDLAEASGVSAPMLSQVERGETSPTLAVAERIAEGLSLSLSQLLRLDEGPALVVVRRDERRRGGSDPHQFEFLTPDHPGQRFQIARHTLTPHAATGDEPMHRPGAREFALVERGPVTLELDNDQHRLDTGDAVTFDADLRHRFVAGAKPVCILSVLTAGARSLS
jgi:transcriptional regulator with XRE-family HTH domain